jgi:hypothetical protein
MRRWSFLVVLLLSSALIVLIPARGAPTLEEVAGFPNQQVTGITVSKTGRIFVCFPFWSDDHTTSVAELTAAGAPKPYPDGIVLPLGHSGKVSYLLESGLGHLTEQRGSY